MKFNGLLYHNFVMMCFISKLTRGTNTGDVSVVVGNEVTLSCTLPSDQGGMFIQYTWFRGENMDTVMASWEYISPDPINQPGFPTDEYEMTIDTSTANSNFTIKNIDLDDEAIYWCEAGYFPSPFGGNPKKNMSVVVVVEPKEIAISNNYKNYSKGEKLEVIDGNYETLTCESKGNKPEVLISWTVDNIAPLPTPPTSNSPNSVDDRLWDSTSDYTYTVLWDNHGEVEVRCTAINDVLPNGISTYVTLDVKVPPYNDKVLIYNGNEVSQDGSIAVNQGELTTLTCKAQDTRPSADLEWYIDGVKQTTGIGPPVAPAVGNDEVVDTTSKLTFIPKRQNHKQIVSCKASIPVDGAPDAETNATLNVIGPPDDPEITLSSSLTENKSSLLQCTAADAYPGGEIVWSNDAQEIRIGGINETNLNNRFDIKDSFEFSPHRSDNKGTITCEVRHETLEGSSPPKDSAEIDVKFCSEAIDIIPCPTVEVGNMVILTCMSKTSNPETILEWYEGETKMKNTHQPITSTAEYQGFAATLQFRTRQIIRSDYNNVNFTCCGTNMAADCIHTCSDPCNLDVKYPPENVLIEKSPKDALLEGDSIILFCSGDANPPPSKFNWFQDESSLIGDETDSVLYFQKVTRTNAGFYKCVADNGLSSIGESQLVNVTVHYASNITNKDENKRSVNNGDDVIIECIAVSLPNPSFNWTDPNGNKLPNGNDRISITEAIEKEDGVHGTRIKSQLLIRSVILDADGGFYRCEASNGIGQPDIFTINLSGKTGNPPHSSPIGLIVGSSFGAIVLILVIIFLALFLIRRRSLESKSTDQPIKKADENMHQRIKEHGMPYNKEEIALKEIDNSHTGIDNSAYETLDSDEHQYGNVSLNHFIFPRENLEIVKELGHGEFGRVLLATAKGLEEGTGETKVAVKTVKDNAEEDIKEQLRKEFEVMNTLMTALENEPNPNIVRLLGSCMEKDPMYMILEYMANGDLKSQLCKSRTDANSKYSTMYPGSTFSPTQLITFAREVANGMTFLAKQQCIHRDLAARNVLLNEQLVCKVSDFGLARDVMGSEVYERLSQVRLPLRWMAYESVTGKIHTIESDVWSFGVLLWEIVTLGSRPYPRLKAPEIRQLLKSGKRMPKPRHCSEQLYKIMLECWEKEPKNRPTFVQLIERLNKILESEMGYLSLEDLDIKLYEDIYVPAENEKV